MSDSIVKSAGELALEKLARLIDHSSNMAEMQGDINADLLVIIKSQSARITLLENRLAKAGL